LPEGVAGPPVLLDHGHVDVAVAWQRATIRDPPSWERALGTPLWGVPEGPEPGFVPNTRPRYPRQPPPQVPEVSPFKAPLSHLDFTVDLGKAKGKVVEGFLHRQPRVLDGDMLDHWERESSSDARAAGLEPLPAPFGPQHASGLEPLPALYGSQRPTGLRAQTDEERERDARAYDDGSRDFTFDVHQLVFYDPKMRAAMFPERSWDDTRLKKR